MVIKKKTKIEKEVNSLIVFMKRLKTYNNKKAFENYMKRKEIVWQTKDTVL